MCVCVCASLGLGQKVIASWGVVARVLCRPGSTPDCLPCSPPPQEAMRKEDEAQRLAAEKGDLQQQVGRGLPADCWPRPASRLCCWDREGLAGSPCGPCPPTHSPVASLRHCPTPPACAAACRLQAASEEEDARRREEQSERLMEVICGYHEGAPGLYSWARAVCGASRQARQAGGNTPASP